ncbi:MAG: murein biosynthesis integral membrane protein MurJ, partial [bacterium]
VADAFWAGITIPSTFRMLFAEGALSAAFIPILSRIQLKQGEEEGIRFARSILNLLVLVVAALVIVAILTAPFYASALFHKWQDNPERIALATRMIQMMFPFLFFISLSAWAMGIQNTHNRFFLPAVSPAVYNVVVICGAVFAGLRFSETNAAYVMAIAVVVGGLFQFAFQVPAVRGLGYFSRAAFQLIHPETKAFLIALTPTVFGLAVYQVNLIVNRLYFASYLEEGSISSLMYAFRLLQFPQGVLGVAVATAALPQMVQDAAQSSGDAFRKTTVRSLRILILILIPASIGLVVIGHDLVGVVYNRGKFRIDELLNPTTSALIAYSIGLLFFSAGKLLTQGFYAYRDVSTPVKIGCVTLVVNVVCCRLLVYRMGVAGLALSSTIASAVQVALLFLLLFPRLPGFPTRKILTLTMKALLCAAFMGIACWLTLKPLAEFGEGFTGYGIRVFAGVGVGMMTYAGLAWLFLREEISTFLKTRRTHTGTVES